MSYDLVLLPRTNRRDPLPSLETVADVLVQAGAVALNDSPDQFRLVDPVAGNVDVDIIGTPAGVIRVEVSTSSEASTPAHLYRFAAASAAALDFQISDPQGGDLLSPAEVGAATRGASDLQLATWVGSRTLLTAYLFLPLALVWLFKGASPRSALFPVVVVLALATAFSVLWEKYARRH